SRQEARRERHSLRPVLTNELEVALEAPGCKHDRASTEILERALPKVLCLETIDSAMLLQKFDDLRVPYKSDVGISEAGAVDRRDEPQPTTSRDVGTWNGVAGVSAQT